MKAPADGTFDPDEVRDGLLVVARGTEYFMSQLAKLADSDFLAPSLLPDWTRAHVIAHLAYNAQALGNLVEWAATGKEKPMYASPEERARDIEQGARLRASELRTLVAESAHDLSNRWEAMPSEAWAARLRTAQGHPLKATSMLWMRTREVWLHAVDLDTGGSFTDFPPEMIDRLQADVLSTWRKRPEEEEIPNFVLVASDRAAVRSIGDVDDASAVVLHGTAAQLASWATGRGASGVRLDGDAEPPRPPRWL